ncbi:hypothetical protein DL763_001035 [Monosporascus cannonballus]|nr:hypothetical protein DL763_001035 [Monosporascus cannonballus]
MASKPTSKGISLLIWANTAALGGAIIWAIYKGGLGQHIDEVSPDQRTVLSKIIMIGSIIWLLATMFMKLAVLWLYFRIFTTQKFRRWSYSMFALVVCYGITFLAVFINLCQPVSHLWNPVPGGRCWPMVYQEYASLSLNLALDTVIVAMPMPVLWGLQMPFGKKVVVSIMFSIGMIRNQNRTNHVNLWGLQTIGGKFSRKRYRETYGSQDGLRTDVDRGLDLTQGSGATRVCAYAATRKPPNGQEMGREGIYVQKNFGSQSLQSKQQD